MKTEITSIVIGFVVVLNLQIVKSHPNPTDDTRDLANQEKAGESSLRSDKEPPKKHSKTIIPVTYHVSPDSGIMDHGPAESIPFGRERRSAGKTQSSELQSLFSGNWAGGQNPDSFFRLLNLLQSKEKEPVFPDDDYEDEELDPPIDLVYYGKKPYPVAVEAIPKTRMPAAPFSEPISLMSSGKARGFTTALDDDPVPLQMHRLKKSGYPYTLMVKRGYFRRSMPLGHDMELYYPLPYQSGKKDFTMLPNGEIALTQHGLHSLRHLLQPPTHPVDEGVPVIRRPIL